MLFAQLSGSPSTNHRPQIGKTSAVVLTLSGVLKDILLVMASMSIFGDPVTPLQMFGYSIALGGLLYYKLGADSIKDYTRQASNAWADFGARQPIFRKIVIFACVIVGCFMLLSGVAPSYGASLPMSEMSEPAPISAPVAP
jgi:hypothetical protein